MPKGQIHKNMQWNRKSPEIGSSLRSIVFTKVPKQSIGQTQESSLQMMLKQVDIWWKKIEPEFLPQINTYKLIWDK